MADSRLPLLLAIALHSCVRPMPIDVDLEETELQYVIEGEVTDAAGPYSVTISQTKNFEDSNTFPLIAGAVVVITDATSGAVDTLKYINSGRYEAQKLVGIAGHTYRLYVKVGDRVFGATSIMPAQAVELDSLYTKESGLNDDVLFMVPVFTDPQGKGNYYRIRQWINNNIVEGSFAVTDDAGDGIKNEIVLNYRTGMGAGHTIANGDLITAELQCVNKDVYNYYRTLAQTIQQNTATPSNPVSNIEGGALGVFNTATSRKLTVKVVAE